MKSSRNREDSTKSCTVGNCELCNTSGNLHHLFVRCSLANYSWTMLGRVISRNLTETNIIFGVGQDVSINTIITVVCFTLYKYWLLCNKENKPRNVLAYRRFMSKELKWKAMVYSHMGKVKIASVCTDLIQLM